MGFIMDLSESLTKNQKITKFNKATFEKLEVDLKSKININ
jgi:hypothetical protein